MFTNRKTSFGSTIGLAAIAVVAITLVGTSAAQAQKATQASIAPSTPAPPSLICSSWDADCLARQAQDRFESQSKHIAALQQRIKQLQGKTRSLGEKLKGLKEVQAAIADLPADVRRQGWVDAMNRAVGEAGGAALTGNESAWAAAIDGVRANLQAQIDGVRTLANRAEANANAARLTAIRAESKADDALIAATGSTKTWWTKWGRDTLIGVAAGLGAVGLGMGIAGAAGAFDTGPTPVYPATR